MSNVKETGAGVKHETRPGRPALRSVAIEREIVRACAREAVVNGKVPSDSELGQQVGLGESTVRDVRLQAGLNRRDIKAWVRERQTKEAPSPEEGVLCWTPFAGPWLLVPLIMKTVFWSAGSQLEWTVKTAVTATSWVLTILMWAVLGFRRFFHLDDFRHHADLGLALFTGSEALAGWIQRINQQRIAIPWLGHLVLQMEVASLPVGLAAQPRAAARRLFANRQSAIAT